MKEKLAAFQKSRMGLFVKKVMDDQAPNLAALLAWGTLSAVLPLLLGMLSLAGLVLRDQQRLDEVYGTVTGLLPASAAGPITTALNGIRNAPAGSVGVVALLLLLFNGSAFFSNMATVFDQAYHVQGRNFVLERLVALLMLIVTTILFVLTGLAAGLSALVGNVPLGLPIGPVLGKVVGWSVSILSVLVLFLLIYRVLPNARQGWRDVIPGTVLSSVLLLVVSQVFPLYTTLFPPNQAYAVFGVFLVFTFWLYILGFVFVLGAELNAYLEQPARSLALAEATASAAHGRAEFEQDTGRVRAEASGQSPDLRGGVLGQRAQSASSQVKEHGGESPAGPPVTGRQQGGGLGGRLIGFAGLVLAMVVLRGRAGEPSERAHA